MAMSGISGAATKGSGGGSASPIKGVAATCSSMTSSFDGKKYLIHRGGREGEERAFEEVRTLIQGMLQGAVNLSTLIGSGASADVIPTMGKIYESYEEKVKGSGAAEHQAFSKMVEACCAAMGMPSSSINLETLLTWLDGCQRVGALRGKQQEFHEGLLEQYRQSIASFADSDKKAQDNEVLGHYMGILQGLGQPRQIKSQQAHTRFGAVNLFTTNQDLYHERALEKNGYPYTDGFANGLWPAFEPIEFHRRPIDLEERFRDRLNPVTPFFKLVKLHGSMNWLETRDPDGRTTVVRVPVKDCRLVEMRDATGSPIGVSDAMVAPTDSKYALTQSLPYVDLFHEFVDALSVPNTVLIAMGFSFGDAHIAHLVENALRRSNFILIAFFGSDALKEGDVSHAFMQRNKQPNAYYITPKPEPAAGSSRDAPTFIRLAELAAFMAPSIPEPTKSIAPSGPKPTGDDDD